MPIESGAAGDGTGDGEYFGIGATADVEAHCGRGLVGIRYKNGDNVHEGADRSLEGAAEVGLGSGFVR